MNLNRLHTLVAIHLLMAIVTKTYRLLALDKLVRSH